MSISDFMLGTSRKNNICQTFHLVCTRNHFKDEQSYKSTKQENAS